MNRALFLLTLCQGLHLTNNVTFIAINGPVGLALAPSPWMATLPVTGYVAGGAIAASLVARHQRTFGRRRAFQLGALVAIGSTLLAAWAAWAQSFGGVVVATVIAGYYNANAGLYRFAATELVPASHRDKAISWVLAGGILGAVAGPNLASATRELLPGVFTAAYLALAGVGVLSFIVLGLIRFPPLPQPSALAPGRPLREIARQPVFIVALLGGSLGYGVMNLLMAATPIAMAQCSHPFSAAAWVLEWHVLGMFVPGFFTGSLIQRFGAPRVMAAGVALNAACIAVALSGVELSRFLIALTVLGVGWNFLFIGATSLLTQAYRPEEKTGVQAAMDTAVMATMTITSFGSGALVTTQGWTWLNVGSIVPVMLTALALIWLASRQRAAQNQRLA